MNRLVIILILLSIFACEKPAPQKPKVISTHTYFDTISKDSIILPAIKLDSMAIKIDSIDVVELP